MDMTLAEMDVFWEGRSFWRKKRIRKFLIFKFEISKKKSKSTFYLKVN
jgi:hypothetical protein